MDLARRDACWQGGAGKREAIASPLFGSGRTKARQKTANGARETNEGKDIEIEKTSGGATRQVRAESVAKTRSSDRARAVHDVQGAGISIGSDTPSKVVPTVD